MSRHGRERTPGRGRVPITVALAACLAAGALYAVQARPGFAPTDHALELTRPSRFVLPGSGAVGPSELGLLRWEGDAPLRLRLPGLGPPARLRLKLFPECPGAVLELRADGRAFAELALAPRWTLYETAPATGGDVLTLAWAARGRPCPVHLSAVRTTTIARQSSDFPRYWVVRSPPGVHPPPPGGLAPWAVAALLLASAAAAVAVPRARLASWLRLVAPGVVLLAVAEVATRAGGLHLVYPPASFAPLLLFPGLVLLAWRHRRAILARARPPVLAALRAVRARPAPALAAVALVGWAWILSGAADRSFGGDLRGLVHFGPRFDTASAFPGVPTASPSGYDGQFYAVLATDPFLTDPATLERLDNPSFRATRILIPLLAWALALGRPAAAVWTYMGLCWMLALATVPLVARWLEARGSSGWWAALLLLNAGLAASLLRVTLDGAALFFLLLALAAHRRERVVPAALAATAAALTREVFLLGSLALAAVELLRGRWSRAAALGVPPVLVVGLWRLRVAAVTETSGRAVANNFSVPFTWIPEKLSQLEALAGPSPEWLWAEVAALLALALAVAGAVRLLPWAGRDVAVLALVAFSCLAVLLSVAVYETVHAYARVLAPLPVLCLASSGNPELPRTLRWWLRAVALLSAVAGLCLVLMSL